MSESPVIGLVHAMHAGNVVCESPSYMARLEELGLLPAKWRRTGITCPDCIAVMDA